MPWITRWAPVAALLALTLGSAWLLQSLDADVLEGGSASDHIPDLYMEEFTTTGAIETHWDFTVNLPDEQWHRMIRVHLDGPFFCTREALKIMNRQTEGAAIINMGSIMGTAGGGAVKSSESML